VVVASTKISLAVTTSVGALVLAGALWDVATPLGQVPWLLYFPAVLLTVLRPSRWDSLALAGGCTILIWVGYFFPTSEPDSVVRFGLFNRSLGTATLWLIAGGCFRYKVIQRGLRESLARYRRLFEHANDGLFVFAWTGTGTPGRFLEVNATACAMLGYSREELLTLTPSDIGIPMGSDHPAGLSPQPNSTQGVVVERYLTTKDGRSIPAEIGSHLVLLDARPVVFAAARNITERKRAQESLDQLRHQYERILNAASEGIYGLDADGHITFMNQAAARMTGWQPAEIVGHPHYALLHHLKPYGASYRPEDNPIYATIKDGGVRGADSEIFWRKDGTSFPVEYVVSPIRQADGTPAGAVLTFQNITERKRAEEALRHSEARYRRIIETASEGIWMIDARNRTTFANQRMADMLGDTPEAMLGRPLFDFMDAEAQAGAQDHMQRQRLGLSAQHDFKFRRRDGSDLWAMLATSPIMDDEGRYIGALTMATDITERKRAESTLRTSEERYRILYEDNPSMYFTLDRNGTVLSVNRFGAEQLGFGVDELIGQSVLTVFHEEDRAAVQRHLALLLERPGLTRHWELRKIRKDGVMIWVEEYARAVRREDGSLTVLVVCSDISVRKQLERALQLTQFAVDHSSEGMCIVAADGRILAANDTACRRLEYTREELLAMTISDIDPLFPRERWPAHWQELKTAGRLVIETINRTKQGRTFPVRVSIAYLPWANEECCCSVITDITERKQADAAIRESEERYRLLVTQATDLIYRTDATGHVTFVNPTAMRLMGYAEPECLGRRFDEFIRPDFRAQAERFYGHQFVRKTPTTYFEFPARTKDGLEIWFGQNVQLMQQDGRVAGFSAVARDITERKRIEQALQESEGRLRSLFDASPIGLSILDLAGHYIQVNEAFVRMTGYSDEELRTRTFLDITHPEDREPNATFAAQAALGEIRSYQVEKRYVRKDSTLIWVHVTGTVLRNHAGQVTHRLGMVEDITQRKRVEEALRLSNERFELAAEGSREGLWDVQRPSLDFDNASLPVYYSPRFKALLGLTDEEFPNVLGSWTSRLHPDDRARVFAALYAHWNRKEPYEIEYRLQTKSGAYRWYVARGQAMWDEAGHPLRMAGSLSDITERKQAEEQLRLSHEQLQALTAHLQSIREEERTRIARELHDELGQGLTGLKMDVAWLQKQLASLGLQETRPLLEKTGEMENLIHASVQGIRRLVSELRPPILDHLGLVDALKWLAHDFQKRQAITCEFACSIPDAILSASATTALFRIAQEALTNVARHAKATHVNMRMTSEDGHLQLTIRDNGVGFDEAAASRPASFGIIGIQERVRLLGGAVRFRGRQGKGTQMTVRIPWEHGQ